MPYYTLYRHTWREELIQLATQGIGFEEFSRRAETVVPDEQKEHIMPRLAMIYVEVQCEKGILGERHDTEKHIET